MTFLKHEVGHTSFDTLDTENAEINVPIARCFTGSIGLETSERLG